MARQKKQAVKPVEVKKEPVAPATKQPKVAKTKKVEEKKEECCCCGHTKIISIKDEDKNQQLYQELYTQVLMSESNLCNVKSSLLRLLANMQLQHNTGLRFYEDILKKLDKKVLKAEPANSLIERLRTCMGVLNVNIAAMDMFLHCADCLDVTTLVDPADKVN